MEPSAHLTEYISHFYSIPSHSPTLTQLCTLQIQTRASNEGYPKVCQAFTITEKARTRVFSWLKVTTSSTSVIC